MTGRHVLLINTNEMKPPVAPLALDYLGGALAAAGFAVRLVDLCFAEDAAQAIAGAVAEAEPLLIGLSLRNTDDCYLLSQACFVPRFQEIVQLTKQATSAPLVVGGCGFSIFAEVLHQACGVDFGIVGDGEATLVELARALEREESPAELPGLIHRPAAGRVVAHPPRYRRSLQVPTSRRWVDNPRYLREGGMGNLETKRGCPGECVYCADPVAKGERVRCRPPADVADEVESLLAHGVDVLHLCDAEFNLPPEHGIAVCEELAARRLGEQVRWYAYATARGFSTELALAMARAGCVGINFGVDSGCDRMLRSLRRGYSVADIRAAVAACRLAGITVMLDLLLGAPGEDPASVTETIRFVQSVDPDRVGAAMGVRVYPGTALAQQIERQGPLAGNPNLHGHREDNSSLLQPIFFVDRQLGEDPFGLVSDLIAGDERFFPPPRPQDDESYNYNDNTALQQAIAAGERGAFWDILRRAAS